MITPRMLGLLHTRLVANAPRQAGSHEYRMGVDDAIAAMQRLVEAGGPGGAASTWMGQGSEETAGPDRTHLAAEYLQLEMTSLLRTIDSMLQRSSTAQLPDDAETSALLDAKAHLVQARGALMQAHESASS